MKTLLILLFVSTSALGQISEIQSMVLGNSDLKLETDSIFQQKANLAAQQLMEAYWYYGEDGFTEAMIELDVTWCSNVEVYSGTNLQEVSELIIEDRSEASYPKSTSVFILAKEEDGIGLALVYSFE